MFCTNCGSQLSDGQKFCGSCGTKLGSAPIAAATPDTSHPNSGNHFSHYAHAFNALFGTRFYKIDHVTEYGEEHGVELLNKAATGDPESLLTISVIYSASGSQYLDAHPVAKNALDNAQKAGLDLGRYWFGYGYALEQADMFDDAIDAHETALDLGFGPAAFNFGRLMVNHNLDLSSAVRIWKIGRDKFNDYICKEMLTDSEVSPGVYQTTVPNGDGTSEVLIASDNPGGLGTFK